MKTEIDVAKRWMEGMDHHPKSKEIYTTLEKLDFALGGDSMTLASGGDGDNGENIMYLLDVHFEAEDNGELEELYKHVDEKTKAMIHGQHQS